MCWSGEASLVLATCGFTGAYISYRHKHPTSRVLPIFYFSLMELLQAFTYIWIGKCGNEYNLLLTNLSYLHICFQPFFVNMFAMSFRPKEVWAKAKWIWAVSAIASIILVAMWAFPAFPDHCYVDGQNMCGLDTCSYHGSWHISWRLILSNLDPHYMSYMAACFIVPLFYGAWRIVLYHLIFGPMMMFFLSSNKDEQPAIWCLMSIGLLTATHIPVLNKWLSK